MMINYRKYIEINPNVRFGKPVIKNTRISVYDILSMLAGGMSEEEILFDFPQLKKEHIKASLFFASDKERNVEYLL